MNNNTQLILREHFTVTSLIIIYVIIGIADKCALLSSLARQGHICSQPAAFRFN